MIYTDLAHFFYLPSDIATYWSMPVPDMDLGYLQ